LASGSCSELVEATSGFNPADAQRDVGAAGQRDGPVLRVGEEIIGLLLDGEGVRNRVAVMFHVSRMSALNFMPFSSLPLGNANGQATGLSLPK